LRMSVSVTRVVMRRKTAMRCSELLGDGRGRGQSFEGAGLGVIS
jgi:hypothetical protein